MKRVLVATLASLAVLGSATAIADVPRDSVGTEFWLAFPGNAAIETRTLSVQIAARTAARGHVRVPGLATSTAFAVSPGAVTTVAVPSDAELTTAGVVQARGVRVTADAPIAVVGENNEGASVDTFLGLPTDVLGTDFVALAAAQHSGYAGQLAIVAAANDTVVTVVPSVAVNGHAAGVPFDVTLEQGHTLLLRSQADGSDLSGTTVRASAPVGVFAGHRCANVPLAVSYCDHLNEAMPPTSTWGRRFVVNTATTGRANDVLRITAARDGTALSWDPPFAGAPATLDRGRVVEITNAPDATALQATGPLLVMQYARGGSTSLNGDSDPFQMQVPPVEQYLPTQVTASPSNDFATHLMTIVAPAGAAEGLTIDGTGHGTTFSPVGSGSYVTAQVAVTAGSHVVGAPSPIGVQLRGAGSPARHRSYGHVGGLLLGRIVDVDVVTLTPATATPAPGTEHCMTATVVDAARAPLAGIRVDFTVSGAHPATGFAFTGEDGAAAFCRTETTPGGDTVEAVAALDHRASASVTWQSPPMPGGSPGPPAAGPAPAGPPAPGIAPTPRVAMPLAAAQLLRALRLPRAATATRAGSLRLGSLACPALCGRLTIVMRPARGKGSFGRLTIAGRPGTSRKLAVGLTRAARRALIRRQRLAVRLELRFTDALGRTTRATHRLTVRAPRRR